jgi:hypothetical protein
VARTGQTKGAYTVSPGEPEGKRPLEKHRHIWEDNIKTDLQELYLMEGFGLNCSGSRQRQVSGSYKSSD